MTEQGELNELALFAGAGGGILGGHLLGWRTVCAVEWEPYPASVLCARQNDGLLPPFPIWDDVQTFDGKPWRGIVDVVSGGFPCQDISAAGGGGLELTESAAGCGEKWRASFTKYNPDSRSWKTHQCSLLEDLEPFLETWPQWGLMRNGECWEQQTLAQITKGTGYGLLERIPTPQTRDWKGSSGRSMKGLEHDLPTHAKKWPTPQASDNRPRATFASTQRRMKMGKQISLEAKVKWTTPTAHMAKETNAPSEYLRNTPTLTAQAGGQLNPTWVEKLMGWPDEWTSIKPINHITMCFWLMGMHNETEIGRDEVLRMLQDGDAAQEIQREIGRSVSIYEAAILLAELCEYKNRPNEARVFMACAEALEEEVRSLWLHEGATGSPHRSGQDAQRLGEHSDVMQALSRLLAHHGKAAWQDGSWEDAIPRVANGVSARVDRLKAIGNGQVPLCAATAWRILNAP